MFVPFILFFFQLTEVDTLKNTCLMSACLEGGVETVEYILSHTQGTGGGTNTRKGKSSSATTSASALSINHKNNEGVNAMMYACRGGNVKVVRLLVARGASLNDVDSHGNTPLYYAAMYGHTAVIKYLLKKVPPLPLPSASINTSPLRFH